MATIGTYNRVILSGTLGSSEVWSTGCNFANVSGSASVGNLFFSDLQTWADTIAAYDWDANYGGLHDILSSAGIRTTVRVEARSAAGLLQAAESQVAAYTPAAAGPSMPPQSALVLSLGTGIPGRRFRGRMYIPMLTGSIGSSSLRITSPSTATLAGDGSNLVTQISVDGPAAPGVVPVVVSVAGNAVTEVTSVRVGDVVDTQRRRRDELPESYAEVPV